MIAILKVGGSAFAFKKTANPTKALELLSDAQLVDYTYRSDAGGYVYFPADEKRQRHHDVAVEMITESALRGEKPKDGEPLDDPEPTARRRCLQLPPSA